MFLELADDEWLIELECDLLGKSALMELEFWSDDDDRTGGVVDSLAEEVLAEATLLALDHVREGFERTIAGAQDRTSASTVVEERVDRLLEHSLLVADDDLRGVEVHQLLETVVPVDDSSIEIVEIGCREVARFEKNQRAKIRWDHGHDVEDHPGRIVAAESKLLDELEALGQILDSLLGAGLGEFLADFGSRREEIDAGKELGDGVGAHEGLEGAVSVSLHGDPILVLVHDLLHLQIRVTRIDDDVVLEVDDLLEVGGLHLKQGAQATRKPP